VNTMKRETLKTLEARKFFYSKLVVPPALRSYMTLETWQQILSNNHTGVFRRLVIGGRKFVISMFLPGLSTIAVIYKAQPIYLYWGCCPNSYPSAYVQHRLKELETMLLVAIHNPQALAKRSRGMTLTKCVHFW